MAGKRIETMDLRQMITLKKQGLSNRKIAPLLQISRNTVNSYTQVFESLNNNYDYLLALDDLSLQELCAPESEVSADRYEALASQFEYFAAELKKPGYSGGDITVYRVDLSRCRAWKLVRSINFPNARYAQIPLHRFFRLQHHVYKQAPGFIRRWSIYIRCLSFLK